MKTLKGFNRCNDLNGNAIIKAFYTDNSTEIIRGGKVNDFYVTYSQSWNGFNKSYKTYSGLKNSKL